MGLQRAIRFVAAIAFLVTTLAAPAITTAAYPEDCHAFLGYYQRYTPKYWPGVPYLLYDGSVSETRVRNLAACTNPTASNYGWTGIWGANIDNYVGGGQGFAQLGYVKTANICCVNGLPANALRFAYTQSDTSGGYFVLASWAGNPIVNHRYELKIRSFFSGSYKWDYCIQDTDGANVEVCQSTSASFHTAQRSMWMFETRTRSDQLGNGIDEPTTFVVQMQYRTTNGQWFYWDPSSCSNGGPSQPDFRCVDGGTNDIRGYTYE